MRKDSALLYPLVETWWPSNFWDGVRLCIYNLACAGLSIKRSAFITWLGQCVLFLCKTLFSHSAHSTQECKLMSEVSQESLMKCQGGWGGGGRGGNHGMDWYLVQGVSSNTPTYFMWGNQDYKPMDWMGHCSNTNST